ncbi:hypothetical protein [Gottfriedia luciferensis]|uniref:hypothetical protein n=1 Tax=Gottfriedia luciferensis TaxID=178774 RepID=UPI000B4351A4|nr:hypothetical protein [Gottfriedia luciferensis]
MDFPVVRNISELENRSEFIVKVKTIQDDSQFILNGIPLGQRKQVEILKSYKGKLKTGEKIMIIERTFLF